VGDLPHALALLAQPPRWLARRRRGRLLRPSGPGGHGMDPDERAAEHGTPGRGGRVPLQHDVRIPQGAARWGRHARARRRHDAGRQGRGHARHHGQPHDKRPRTGGVQDAQADQAARRRLLVRAAGEAALPPWPAAPRLPFPRHRDRAPRAAERLHGRRLPRAYAQGGPQGVSEDPDHHRDQGPHVGWGDRGARAKRRDAGAGAEEHVAPRSDRLLLPAGGG
jgi:hypothetical protein